jgi:hypothetical protein
VEVILSTGMERGFSGTLSGQYTLFRILFVSFRKSAVFVGTSSSKVMRLLL